MGTHTLKDAAHPTSIRSAEHEYLRGLSVLFPLGVVLVDAEHDLRVLVVDVLALGEHALEHFIVEIIRHDTKLKIREVS